MRALPCISLSLLLVSPFTWAQAVNYSRAEAETGKPVQIGTHASARKDCTPAPLPTIRLLEFPRAGTATVKPGTLTTDRVPNCPKLQTGVQIVLYASRGGYSGPDRLSYEVTSANGQVETFTISIDVRPASASVPPPPGKPI